MASWIDLTIEGSTATILINKPESLNSLSMGVLREFHDRLDQLATTDIVRCLIIRGAGDKAFIAGADIKEMNVLGEEGISEFANLGSTLATKISTLPFPVVAMVDGYCLGGGFEMALACDFIVATEAAVLGLPEMSLGLIPGFGGTQRLKERVSKSLYQKIIYLGTKLNAEEALNEGVADFLFNEEELSKFTSKLSKLPTKAFTKARDCYLKADSLEMGLSQELEQFKSLFSTEDAKEGISAFTQKRKANFKGK